MTDIKLKTGDKKCIIHCGKGSFEKYAPLLSDRNLFVITDENVFGLYKNLICESFKNAPVKVLPCGEKAKTLKYLQEILESFLMFGVTREWRVLAFGGGVVGDIAALAASLYMRGVHLVQIPTTLLAQVDSSVGGKTAVNFKNIKNLLGTFYQPEQVISDGIFLNTLPKKEIKCGVGEIIKYAALDKDIFENLTKNSEKLLNCEYLSEITPSCIERKVKIVSADERDLLGIRKTLNLGHTTGHALELSFGRKSHGEYVMIGMYYEMYIAKKLSYITGEYMQTLQNLITSVIKVPSFSNIERAAEFARYDKKNLSFGKISIIVPKDVGVTAEISLEFDEYVKLLKECSESLEKI